MGVSMKILYVEDQLYSNIPAIIEMFGSFVGKKVVKTLTEFEHDEDGFGASNEDIAEALRASPLDVAYTFPMALKMLNSGKSQYEAFIIDRNLSCSGEDEDEILSEVQKNHPGFTEDQHIRYYEREGDYLLKLLSSKQSINLKEQVFFLTANAGDSDAIRGTDQFEDLVSLDAWRTDNIIEKGSSAAKDLKDQINNIPSVKMISRYPDMFNAARLIDAQETSDRLLKVLLTGDNLKLGRLTQESIDAHLLQIRKLFEALAYYIVKSRGLSIEPSKSGRKTMGSYLWAIKKGKVWKRDEVEDNIASMIWNICSPSMHYNESDSLETLYKLAHNGILHLYEWAGKSLCF
jgi:hypothetical protein